MKIFLPKKQILDPEQFIRRCGYGKISSRRGGEVSYARRADRDMYPRFHIYVEDRGGDWSFNLHLDQRAPVYAGVTAHSGEYDGEVVEREGKRIQEMINKNPAS